MPFKFRDDIDFYKENDRFFLFWDSWYWGGQLRFGDFVMASTLLYIAKMELMRKFKPLNNNNLHFVLNLKSKAYLQNFERMLGLFKNVYDGRIEFNRTDEISEKCNVSQIYPRGNLWQFKGYLDNAKYTLPFGSELISPPIDESKINRDTVYILPIFGKGYNTERNWTPMMLREIIEGIDPHNKIKIISIDNYRLRQDTLRMIKSLKRDNITILKKENWYDIINGIALTGREYISGDCGMTHFVCALPEKFRPHKIHAYYNTKGLKNGPKWLQSIAIEPDKVSEHVDFRPYSPYPQSNLILYDF